MKTFVGMPMLAGLAIVLASSQADARYAGAVSYNSCDPCCQPQTHTVYKTVKCVEYDRVEETRYKTVYDRVCEDKVVNYTKHVTEQRQKQVNYTVMKPVYETKTRTYTVNKPVYETIQKQVNYTVMKPVYETKTRTYTVHKPVYETRTKEVPYTVMKP
ncbi:MAG: hypothetical protein AAGJ46_21210, partial [Planctomycetota bacterium]